MAQGKRIRLVTTRLWVQSLAPLSGLGSGVSVSCGVGRRRGLDLSGIAVAVVEACSCSSNQTPSLGTSMCREFGPEKKKEYLGVGKRLPYLFLKRFPEFP